MNYEKYNIKKKEKTCQHLLGRSVFCCTFSPFIGSMLLALLRLLKYIVPTTTARTIPTTTPNTILNVLFLWFLDGPVVEDDDNNDDDDDVDDGDDRLVDSEDRFVAGLGLGAHFLLFCWLQCWFVAFKPCITHSSCITSFPSKQQYEHCWQLWMCRAFLTK